jgi:hypothetical protein
MRSRRRRRRGGRGCRWRRRRRRCRRCGRAGRLQRRGTWGSRRRCPGLRLHRLGRCFVKRGQQRGQYNGNSYSGDGAHGRENEGQRRAQPLGHSSAQHIVEQHGENDEHGDQEPQRVSKVEYTHLDLPKHRSDYRTNAGGDADYEEDPCKGPNYDADKLPTEQRQRKVSRRRDLHRVSTSSRRWFTGRSLEDIRNFPATIDRILVRKSFS